MIVMNMRFGKKKELEYAERFAKQLGDDGECGTVISTLNDVEYTITPEE